MNEYIFEAKQTILSLDFEKREQINTFSLLKVRKNSFLLESENISRISFFVLNSFLIFLARYETK